MFRPRLSPLLVMLVASCAFSPVASPTATFTNTPRPTATRTRTPVPTRQPTATEASKELMVQLDAIYTVVVVVQGNVELLSESASRLASGDLDAAATEVVRTTAAALADRLDLSIPRVTVLDELSASWDQAIGAHEDTKRVLADWTAGEISPQEVVTQLEAVRKAADEAAQGAETVIAPLIESTEAQMAAVRNRWLTEMIEGTLAPPQVASACGEGTSQEAGAGLPGRVAFVSDRDGDPEIYVAHADGSGVVRLTHSPGGDFHPAWSPDGMRIAFYSERDGNPEIYVMNADGSGATRLTHDSAADYDPAWSADGLKIAFHSHRYQGAARIHVMNADGSAVTRLTSPPNDDWSPAWSPDGTQIVFNSSRGDDRDIWVMNADGTRLVNLTDGGGDDWWPDWSPAGDQIVFHSVRDGNFEIYVMTATGEGLTRLTQNPAGDYDPAWSPDGERIVFTSDGAGNRELCVMNGDGTGLFNVTDNPANDWSADWGP